MIFDFLKTIFCAKQDNNAEIKTLKNELQCLTENYKILESSLKEKVEDVNNANVRINELLIVIASNNNEIKTLKDKIENQNSDDETTQPEYISGKMIITPKRRVVSKTKDIIVSFKKPQHVYDKSVYLTELLSNAGFIGCEKTKQNAQKIHDFLVKKIKYERDQSENWRPITETLLAGFGDCEDSGGIALSSAYGICGWKDDEVYNACGVYDAQFGHSYCVVKIGACWYVSEGTNMSTLEKWKDSPKYKANYGICNWKYAGMIKYYGVVADRILDDDE